MDEHRFDTFTRLLARGLRRRTALKVLLAVGAAGTATRTARREAAACLEDGQFCTDDDECCGFCASFNCVDCVAKGTSGCVSDDDCCGGKLTCDGGVCKKKKKKGNGGGGNRAGCEGRKCKKDKKKHDGGGGGGGSEGCQSSLDCEYYFRCMPDGQCVPIECYFDTDCPVGQGCNNSFECYDPHAL